MRSVTICIGLVAITCTAAAAQTSVTRVSTASIDVGAGLRPVQLTVYGTGLGTVSSARLLQSGRAVTDPAATLKGAVPRTLPGTSLIIELSASTRARAGTYELQLVAGRQLLSVPTTVRVVSTTLTRTVTVVPSATGASPGQLVLEAAGPSQTVTLTGTRLNEVTAAYVEKDGSRMTGRFDVQLQSTLDPTRRDVVIRAFSNAGPPWGGPFNLALEAAPNGSTVKITTPLVITVPAPPVDLVIASCAVDSTSPYARRARATIRNQGTQGVSFQNGQVVARFSGAGPARTISAQAGGQYVAGGGAFEVSAFLDLDGVAAGPQAVTWAADPNGIVLEANETNNGRWCPFTWTPPEPEPAPTPTAKPDIVISDLKVDPYSGPPSTAFVVRAEISNVGSAEAKTRGGYDFTASVIAVECTVNGARMSFSSVQWTAPGGAPYGSGTSVDGSLGVMGAWLLELPVNLAVGQKTLQCTVDVLDRFDESIETNNSTTAIFYVSNSS